MSTPFAQRLVSVGRYGLGYGKIAARFSVLFGGIVVFSRLAAELRLRGGVSFDEPVLRFLRERQSPRWTRAMLVITRLGSWQALTVASVASTAVLFVAGHPRAARYVAITSAGASIMNQGAKMLFARQRPDKTRWLSPTMGHAFPSGHAMSSTAIYGAIAFVVAKRVPRWKWPAIGVASTLSTAIGVSRAYLHVHYPSDVLAGWGLGVSWPLWLRKMLP